MISLEDALGDAQPVPKRKHKASKIDISAPSAPLSNTGVSTRTQADRVPLKPRGAIQKVSGLFAGKSPKGGREGASRVVLTKWARSTERHEVPIIGSGVDTLELATTRDIVIPDRVRDAADAARAKHSPAPLEWCDWDGVAWNMEVRPGAGADGPYHLLTCPDFDVRLSRSRRLPSKVTYRANFLWTAGPRRAVEIAQTAVHSLLKINDEHEDVWHVQRVDLCADAHLPFGPRDHDRWRKRAHVAVDKYDKRGVFTGWVFGAGGPVLNRIYLKSLQAKTESPWIFDVWAQCPHYVPGLEVWRGEFELRRKFLKSLEPRIRNTADLWAHQERCWRYLTAKWLYLSRNYDRLEDANGGFCRNVSQDWRCISDWAFADETLAIIEPARRDRATHATLDSLVPQLMGVAKSAVAHELQLGHIERIDVDRAGDEVALLALLKKAIEERRKGADIHRDVWDRLRRINSGADEAIQPTGGLMPRMRQKRPDTDG